MQGKDVDPHFPSLYIALTMAKRPTPKKKMSKDRSHARYGAYVRKQLRKLHGRLNSPFAGYYEKEESGDKALEKITKVKA